MPTDHRQTKRRFLGVQFVDCQVYGRLYLNKAGTVYTGRCPRCGATVRARVGDEGTKCRFFLAVCRR